MKKMKIIEKLNMIKQKYKIDFKVKKKSENWWIKCHKKRRKLKIKYVWRNQIRNKDNNKKKSINYDKYQYKQYEMIFTLRTVGRNTSIQNMWQMK